MTHIPAAMRRHRRALSTFIFLISAGWASAGAPDYTLEGSVVATGGVHEVSNACLALSSVTGQPVAGLVRPLPVPTYGYEITSGFWATYPASSTDTVMYDNFEVCQ